MRLWVPHDQRRPQPEPIETDDALVFAIGVGAWLIALAVVVGMLSAPVGFDPVAVLACIAVGLTLGTVGYIVSRRRTR